ncbi:hypothetical protein ANN_11524 [Periplaneta americana]|uniref:Uncharacterized protein n=1 Tax=Periplaneta americana TaxID=6978 RepID=A0ABQ8T6D8_PERAM|nr:hypothetical protein ANN_11524 [Periplaneta americana]
MGRACSTYGRFKNAHRELFGRPEGKRPLGRARRRWEDNIKMDLREVGYDGRDWINLHQDRDNGELIPVVVVVMIRPIRDFCFPFESIITLTWVISPTQGALSGCAPVSSGLEEAKRGLQKQEGSEGQFYDDPRRSRADEIQSAAVVYHQVWPYQCVDFGRVIRVKDGDSTTVSVVGFSELTHARPASHKSGLHEREIVSGFFNCEICVRETTHNLSHTSQLACVGSEKLRLKARGGGVAAWPGIHGRAAAVMQQGSNRIRDFVRSFVRDFKHALRQECAHLKCRATIRSLSVFSRTQRDSLPQCGRVRCRLSRETRTPQAWSGLKVDRICDSELAIDKMRPRIRHRLPDIRLTVKENLRETQLGNQPKQEPNLCLSAIPDQQANALPPEPRRWLLGG